jgi:hypothetical protein
LFQAIENVNGKMLWANLALEAPGRLLLYWYGFKAWFIKREIL